MPMNTADSIVNTYAWRNATSTSSKSMNTPKSSETTVIYSEYDEQFQAVGILVILLLILDICMLEVKNPLLRNVKFFTH